MTGPPAPPDAVAGTALRPRLPAPTTTRWQPLRLGLTNLYRFDEEEFAFEGGRLLLRGNNGTGKSRVLALTVPFLLDGRTSSHRVEPDGDTAKRMEWNLLLGTHEDRLGYTWMEFARRPDEDDDGVARFATIGCGMRASAGRGELRTWFFVTDQRVGDGLSLVADTGQALTRDRLIEAIGDRGEVVDTAKEYRRLLDRTLFGLGEHRYEALVDLLVQLRRPQLSRQLDESLLSDALSEALPPLPAAVIGDVAEAFRALDDDRDALEGYRDALGATETFLTSYRGYAGVAARRRAGAVTQANARYERLRGQLRDAEERAEAAAVRVTELERQQEQLQDARSAADVEVRTLEASPEMEAVRDLDAARARADELAAAAQERAADLANAAQALERAESERERAVRDGARSRARVTESTDRARTAARAAHLEPLFARAISPLDLPDARDGGAIGSARQRIDDEVARVRRAAAHLVELDGRVRDAEAHLAIARHGLDQRGRERDRAQEEAATSTSALADARAAAITALRGWDAALTALPHVAADDLAELLATWDGTGSEPIAAAAETALTTLRDEQEPSRAALARRRDDLHAERGERERERAELEAGTHQPPPAPHTRDPEVRTSRAGAPLWRLVDLVDAVPAGDAAGYEAGLEAAGLLDAWVTPDGRLLDVDDTELIGDGLAARDDGGLAGVLRPARAPGAEVAAVSPDRVDELLRRIGLDGDGTVWVAADGRWRVGPLAGRWHKDEVEHLGHAARERARQRRLAAIAADLDRLAEEEHDLDRQREALEERLATARRERATAPGLDAVRGALYAVARDTEEVRRQQQLVAAAETEVAERRATLTEVEGDRARAADDLGVPERAADPGALVTDVDELRMALDALWERLEVHRAALQATDRATLDRDRARAEHERRQGQARAADVAANQAATRRDTLADAVGRTADEVLARLAAARGRYTHAGERLEALGKDREEQLLARRQAETEAGGLADQLEEQTTSRSAAVEHLRRLAASGFLDVTGVAVEVPPAEGEWAADPAVRAARRINDQLSEVAASDADWERVQRGLHGHYTTLEQALLPHGLQPAGTFDDDLFVVTTTFQGRAAAMTELRSRLDDEVTQRQSILDAREREMLENHLVGEVATQLHELIRAGESMVTAMNQELASRPTSTGMRLRFSWRPRPDGPDALADARKRLLASDRVWSPEDREALGAFLQARIREVRDADDAGTWQDHLTRALDYRRWHLFAVEREQDGTWVRLTRRTHGTGSGGEKALALTVPQFAAAAAHYRSADAHAPRLIALDEAFVGIDTDMRAKCLDLLVSFDLDVIMTSEREWACYPTVPAVAIHQLSTRPGIDAIGVHRWVWNGHDRLEVVHDEVVRPHGPPDGEG